MDELSAHEQLVEDAKDAISKVHGDSSVDQQTTINSLNDLISEIETMIQGIEYDMSQERE
jgi:hypothetical protein